jgi:hypothetical protein
VDIILIEPRSDDYRGVLEARPAGCNRQGRDTPACQLTRALAELDLALDSMAEPPLISGQA